MLTHTHPPAHKHNENTLTVTNLHTQAYQQMCSESNIFFLSRINSLNSLESLGSLPQTQNQKHEHVHNPAHTGISTDVSRTNSLNSLDSLGSHTLEQQRQLQFVDIAFGRPDNGLGKHLGCQMSLDVQKRRGGAMDSVYISVYIRSHACSCIHI